jgi:tRNA threonylcarbamoyladenosine modification (KEOPS) complex Cgi121 subunit
MKYGAVCFFARKKDELEGVRKIAGERVYVQGFRKGISSNMKLYEMISWQTLYAKENRSLIAEKPEIDFLLRVSGTTQINEAIKKNGFSEGSINIIAVFGEISEVRRLEGFVKLRKLDSREMSDEELFLVEKASLLASERFQLSLLD